MVHLLKNIGTGLVGLILSTATIGQKMETVKVVKDKSANKIDVFIGDKLFTSLLYPDTLEKLSYIPFMLQMEQMLQGGFL
jgi:hypothetical protein